jgi:hypothetical protein
MVAFYALVWFVFVVSGVGGGAAMLTHGQAYDLRFGISRQLALALLFARQCHMNRDNCAMPRCHVRGA